jgi:hypothetical protein
MSCFQAQRPRTGHAQNGLGAARLSRRAIV